MTRPVLLLAGRSRPGKKGALLREALALAGKKAPTVGYVGAAHGDDSGFFKRMAGLLRAAGSGAVRLAPLAGEGDDGSAARAVLCLWYQTARWSRWWNRRSASRAGGGAWSAWRH